jgi:hypothetical protein
MLLLAAVAYAVPPGYTAVDPIEGCSLALGPTQPDGVVPMWGECEWPDVTADSLTAILEKPEDFPRVWTSLRDARVLSRQGSTMKLWELHNVPVFADLEVVVDWSRTAIPGGVRYSWLTTKDAWELRAGGERCRRYDGHWDITRGASGGAHVVEETYYNPGSYPSWLVRQALGGQLAELVGALHEAGRAR